MSRNYYRHFMPVFVLVFLYSQPLFAAYDVSTEPESIFDPVTTNIIWTQGDSDDGANSNIPIGFNFTFAGVTYSQVRVITNGVLHFGANQNFHNEYDNVALATNDADRLIMPMWDDMDPSSGGTVRYSTLGSAPSRRLVVDWQNVPRYGTSSSCSFQVVLYENGSIRFRYSTSNTNCNGSRATIGVEESNSDFTQYSYNSSINLAQDIVFTVPVVTVGAEWRFDEPLWTGAANEVKDSSGNNYHGVATGSTPVAGVLCNAADLSATSTTDYLDLNSAAINGLTDFTMSAWVRTSLSRTYMTLVSAARAAAPNDNELVFLFAQANRVRPIITRALFDDTPAVYMTAINDNQWHHMVWTRRAASRQSCIYRDGVLQGCITNPNSNDTDPLNVAAGGFIIGQDQDTVAGNYDASQAWEGLVDELMVFPSVLSLSQIQAMRTNNLAGNNWDGTPRSCIAADHFTIDHDTSGITCQAEPVTIRAHQADHSVAVDYTGTLNLTTSDNRGDWVLVSGGGSLVNGTLNDGAATYNLVAADLGQVQLSLSHSNVATISINVSSAALSETSGSANSGDDPNLIFANSGFVFLGDGTASNIATQIANKASNVAPNAQLLELQAIRTSDTTGACEAALLNNVAIELAAECRNPSTCSTRQVAVNGSNIAGNPNLSVSAFTMVSLDFADASDSTASLVLNYPDAGQVRLHARYNLPLPGGGPSGNYMQGSSNDWVSRPFGFALTAVGNPAAASAAGARHVRAGETFGVTATAVGWQSFDDNAPVDGRPDLHNDSDAANNDNLSDNLVLLNFGRETLAETVALSSQLRLPVGGTDPGLAGATSVSGFVNGVASLAGVRFDEVGIIEMAANSDGNYLAIGAVESAQMQSRSGFVGRFYPARFTVTANTPSFDPACGLATFTYLDAPFCYLLAPQFTVTAVNAFNAATTLNYGGTGSNRFWYLTPSLSSRSFNNAATSAATLTATVQGTDTLTADTDFDGQGVLSLQAGSPGDNLFYQRVSLEAPFNAAVNINFPASSFTDSDGVCYDADTNGSCDAFTINNVAGTQLRFGRLSMLNAHGSEQSNLTAGLRLEYFDGTNFVINPLDNGSYTILDITDFNYSGTSAETPSTLTGFGAGLGSLDFNCSLAVPCALGYVDMLANLDSNYPWLRYDWGGGSYTDNPSARATFGIFDGSQRHIYIYEVY